MKACKDVSSDEGVIDRTMAFWSSLLTGGELVESAPACFEEVPGKYNVGEIVRDYTTCWLKTPPVNHATPAQLLDLLLFLDDFTQQLEVKDAEHRALPAAEMGDGLMDCEDMEPGYIQVCKDLGRWRARLDEYMFFTASIPFDDQFDRRTTLWEVTAPLFLGWYGGETGSEVELVAGGFPPGFDAELRHVPDIATPYSIANQFGVFYSWEDERKRRFVEEVADPIKTSGGNLLLYAALAAIGYGGWQIITSKQ